MASGGRKLPLGPSLPTPGVHCTARFSRREEAITITEAVDIHTHTSPFFPVLFLHQKRVSSILEPGTGVLVDESSVAILSPTLFLVYYTSSTSKVCRPDDI